MCDFIHQLLSIQIQVIARKKSSPLIDFLYGNGKLLHKKYENPESEFLDDKLIYDIFQKAFTKMLQKFESIDKWINNVDLLNLGMDYGLTVGFNYWLRSCQHINGLELVKLLLKAKANVNYSDKPGGLTPLFCAVDNNQQGPSRKKEMIEELLESKADVNYIDEKNSTALLKEVQNYRNIGVIKTLISFGADVTQPLYWAQENQCPQEVIDALTPSKANIEILSQRAVHDARLEKLKKTEERFIKALKKFQELKDEYSTIQYQEDENYIYKYLSSLKIYSNKMDILAKKANDFLETVKNSPDKSVIVSFNYLKALIDQYKKEYKTHLDVLIKGVYDYLFQQQLEKYTKAGREKFKKVLGYVESEIKRITDTFNEDSGGNIDILQIKKEILLQISEHWKRKLVYVKQVTGYEWVEFDEKKSNLYRVKETWSATNIMQLIGIQNRLKELVQKELQNTAQVFISPINNNFTLAISIDLNQIILPQQHPLPLPNQSNNSQTWFSSAPSSSSSSTSSSTEPKTYFITK